MRYFCKDTIINLRTEDEVIYRHEEKTSIRFCSRVRERTSPFNPQTTDRDTVYQAIFHGNGKISTIKYLN